VVGFFSQCRQIFPVTRQAPARIFGRRINRCYRGKLQTTIEDLDLGHPLIRSHQKWHRQTIRPWPEAGSRGSGYRPGYRLLDRVYAPLISGLSKPVRADGIVASEKTSPLDHLYLAVARALEQLLTGVGLQAAA
jgi:hypothetical protein